MKCPLDQTELLITERQGIEIDYCPQCRGVWLDRGELDKLIERGAQSVAPVSPMAPVAPVANVRRDEDDDYRRRDNFQRPDYDDRHDDDYYKKRKKKGFLGELFDFD